MKKRVLHNIDRPVTFPVVGSVMWWLLLDRLGAPDWLWGAAGVVAIILWGATIFTVFWRQQPTKLRDSVWAEDT